MPHPHPIGDRLDAPFEPAAVVRASVDIAAPPVDVFRALIDPRELAAWLGSETMLGAPRDEHQTDPPAPLPGTAWRAPAIAPDGTTGTVAGEYLSVAPPHWLETTWRASWNDLATERVRFELVPIDVSGVEGTRITVTHTRAEARLHATIATLSHAGPPVEAWPSLLARLATHVVTMSALARWSGHDPRPPRRSTPCTARSSISIGRGECGGAGVRGCAQHR